MESCDVRTRAYKNGKTFDECRQIAEKMNLVLQGQIQSKGKILWTDLLEQADHDEIVYKLTLKYLRRDGYDIGNSKRPEIMSF
ncbi:MAG: hypothetical protein IIA83_04030 [Thaumarchaeota archaeon]|nr:hypothetical protein [Nitrososphaerota archaeon]